MKEVCWHNIKEALSVLMLCLPVTVGGHFHVLSIFLVKQIAINSEKCKLSDSQIDKPQCGCPKRTELPDENINTGVQSINTEI